MKASKHINARGMLVEAALACLWSLLVHTLFKHPVDFRMFLLYIDRH